MNELLIAFGEKPFIPPTGVIQKHKMSDDDFQEAEESVQVEACPYAPRSKHEMEWRVDYILRVMANGEPYTADVISARTGIDRKKIHFTLAKMVNNELLQRSRPESIGAHIPYLYWVE